MFGKSCLYDAKVNAMDCKKAENDNRNEGNILYLSDYIVVFN